MPDFYRDKDGVKHQWPTCEVPGCKKKAQNATGGDNPKPRKSVTLRERFGGEGFICSSHHTKNLARNAGMSHNSFHPYLKYRKDYCENIDGRLGFVCTYEPPSELVKEEMGLEKDFKGFLHTDHIDGNPTNNVEENMQTLCANCHTFKTYINGDNLTEGRKTLRNA